MAGGERVEPGGEWFWEVDPNVEVCVEFEV
jgi:hypothetical protein